MGNRKPKSWQVVRGQRPLSERRTAFYDRLIQAEERLEALRVKRGIAEAAFDAAQVVDPVTGEEETEDLARLARAVAALGGRLELRAVFPDETVTLMLEPESGGLIGPDR